jgi:hypothetical protein
VRGLGLSLEQHLPGLERVRGEVDRVLGKADVVARREVRDAARDVAHRFGKTKLITDAFRHAAQTARDRATNAVE